MRPNLKFVVTESFLQQDAFWGRAADANRHQCLCRFSPVYLAIALLACWMLHWPVSFSPFLSRFSPQIIGPLHNRKTYPASETPLCSQMRIYGEYQSTSDKWETENRKVKVLEAVEGWGRCWGKTAAVQTGYSQWGLLGFSPLKVLQSLNLSHIQSLGWCIHGKTWKWKKKQRHKGHVSRWDTTSCFRLSPDGAADGRLASPRRLGSARTIFCFFFFFPEVTVSKRCCWPLVWFDW